MKRKDSIIGYALSALGGYYLLKPDPDTGRDRINPVGVILLVLGFYL